MDPTPRSSRTCTLCRATFPLTNEYFHHHRSPGFHGFQYTCKACQRTALAQYGRDNPGIQQLQNQRRHQRLRMAALMHYGHDDPACVCCGERSPEFLCIDHINGNGGVRRDATHRSGTGLYRWLKAQGYPEGLRVLCHNCNNSLGHFGYCPHHPPPVTG